MMKDIKIQLFLCSFICFESVKFINAQFFNFQGNFPVNNECFNPNQRRGTCVSIRDCQTLMSVLQRVPLQVTDREFVKASECNNGYGQRPYVCCTSDTGFSRQMRNDEQNDYDDYTNWEFQRGSGFIGQPTLFQYNDYGNYDPRRIPEELEPSQFGNRPEQSTVTKRANNAVSTSARSLPRQPNCGAVTITNKILGGNDADLTEFPWMVLLEYKRKNGRVTSDCAGTLINQRYVLTAAHCIKGAIERIVGPLTSIRLGEHDTSKKIDCNQYTCAPESYRVSIEEKIPHENYRDASTNKENDIALIRMSRNVRFSSTIRPICLSSDSRSLRANTELTVAGWGRTLNNGKSNIKQKLSVDLFSQDQCRRKFRERKVKIVDSQMCAGGEYLADSCDGDSGGPLMRFNGQSWIQEGIVSFGVKCGLQGWPGVYTRISSFENWIRSKLRD